MKTSFPIKNLVWTPNYLGRYWGDIVSAFRIDLWWERGLVLGKIGMGVQTSELDTADMDKTPSDLVEFDGYYWTFTSKVLKTANILTTKFAADALTNTPIDLDDADGVVYQNKLIVSRPTDLAMLSSATASWDATWWTVTLGQPALQSVSHPLATMGSAHLFIGDKNNMHDVFGSDTVYLNRYTVPDTENATIEWIETTSDFVYLGVSFSEGEHTYMVVEFDPISEKAKEIYFDQKAMGFVWNDSFYIILEDGSVKMRQPSSYRVNPIFVPVAQFPIDMRWKKVDLPHRNGWDIYRDKPIFFLKNSAYALYTPAGIYLLDKDIGAVYHWSTVGDDKTYGCPVTNDSEALKGRGFLYVDKNNTISVGASVYRTNLAYLRGIFTSSAAPKPNSFAWAELPRIPTTELDELWQNISVAVSSLSQATNNITIEYKTEDAGTMVFYGGTWTADNKFTYSGSPNNLVVGNAVMILEGDGAGLIAHITDIDTGTTTITIDKSVSGASGDMEYWIDTYKKVESLSLDNGYQLFSFPEQPLTSTWIQVRLLIEQGGFSSVSIKHKPNNSLEVVRPQ